MTILQNSEIAVTPVLLSVDPTTLKLCAIKKMFEKSVTFVPVMFTQNSDSGTF
jgi:hypothetical protein